MKQKKSSYRFFFLLATLSILVPTSIFAQLNLDGGFNPNVTDAPANANISLPLPDGKILVGGNFHAANGVGRRNLVRLNADGTLDNAFNIGSLGPNGSIYEIVPVADGKFLIGGAFTTYNEVNKAGIIRINSDGTPDETFNPGGTGIAGSAVQTISLQSDGKILISGSGISSYNGISGIAIARLNADGTGDTSFASGLPSGSFIETILSTPDNKVLISGTFFSYNGVSVPKIAKLNSDGSLDTNFNNNMGTGIGSGQTGIFASKIQPDGKILIGGIFEDFNGTPRKNIARLNADGTLDVSFIPASNSFTGGIGTEYFSIQTDGKILVSGGFDFDGSSRPLIRLNADGSLDSAGFSNSPADSFGYATSLQADSKIILTGYFTSFDGTIKLGLVRLNSNGTVDSTFSAGVSNFGAVNAVAVQPDDKVIVAGNFMNVNGVPNRNIARLNANGTIDSTFSPGGSRTGTHHLSGTANVVNAVVVQPDGKILVGGIFGSYNGTFANSIARINPDGSIDNSFNVSGLDGLNLLVVVNDILVQPDGKILISGNFRLGTTLRRMVRLNFDGSIDNTFTFNNSGAVFRMVRQPDGKILVAGDLISVSGQPRNRIALINEDGSLDTSFDPGSGANARVNDIFLQDDGKILIGGQFNNYNGTSRNRIVRLFSDGSIDTTFDPGTGADNIVYSISQQSDGKYYVGGLFSTFDSFETNRLVLLNPDGSVDPSFSSAVGSNPVNLVRKLLFQSDGKLLVGGTFNNYGGFPRGSLVRLSSTSQAQDVSPEDPIAEVGTTTIAFSSVTSPGTTIVSPIDPNSTAATLPGGYSIPSLNIAYEIQTTATFNGPIVIAFRVPDEVPEIEFAALRILHGEDGQLVDRTILAPDSPASDYPNRTIYARVNSLSPFVVGKIVTPSNKDQCKDGGYRIFTQPSFKNQGECVSYIQSRSSN